MVAEPASFQGQASLLQTTQRLPGSPGSAVFPEQAWGLIASRLGLSPREGAIVRGVFEDQTEFAIAAELGISPHTVHTHFERLRRKLGVTNRVQLVLSITQEFLRLWDPCQTGQNLPSAFIDR